MTSLADNPRFLRELLAQALEEICEKERLIQVLRVEIARLNQRKFDLSAEAPALCRMQAD